jgi:hypothetical protein
MPERGRRKPGEREAAKTKKPSHKPRGKAGKPDGSDKATASADASQGGSAAEQSIES